MKLCSKCYNRGFYKLRQFTNDEIKVVCSCKHGERLQNELLATKAKEQIDFNKEPIELKVEE